MFNFHPEVDPVFSDGNQASSPEEEGKTAQSAAEVRCAEKHQLLVFWQALCVGLPDNVTYIPHTEKKQEIGGRNYRSGVWRKI